MSTNTQTTQPTDSEIKEGLENIARSLGIDVANAKVDYSKYPLNKYNNITINQIAEMIKTSTIFEDEERQFALDFLTHEEITQEIRDFYFSMLITEEMGSLKENIESSSNSASNDNKIGRYKQRLAVLAEIDNKFISN